MNYKRLILKTNFIIGVLFTIMLAIITFHSYTVNNDSFLSSELVEKTGKIREAKTNGYTRSSGSDLIIILQGDSTQYRSSAPYASKFKYKSKTVDYLPYNSEVTLILEKAELNAEPKQHRIEKYYWKNIVGLKTNEEVHLSPENYKSWHIENWKLGRWIGPPFLLMGIFLIVASIKEERDKDEI